MSKPNILIFMTDHQRADTVLPEHPAITPNLDHLIQDGVAFTQTYCPAPHCCPSRATFFTGLYPSGHGVWNNICNRQALSHGLNDGVRLWSEDLAEAGYQLHYSGKWHVSVEETPVNRGWTEHFVTATASTHHGVGWDYYQELAQNPESARKAGEIARPGYGPFKIYGTGSDKGDPHDETTVAKALEVLAGKNADSAPWCLYVGAIGPHDPYVVPQKYLDMYNVDDIPLPMNFADSLADKPAIYSRLRQTRFGQLPVHEVKDAIRHFWAYCTYLDDLFGQLLAALDATGQADNTLVLYCADHGDYCGEHGLFAKGIPCFRGAYHVPAIMRWPTAIKDPGRRVDKFVSLADFAPTFLDVAGIDSERHFAGESLKSFLEDKAPSDWRDAVFTQCNGVEIYYTQRSVVTREFKYVFNGFDQDELYDYRTDPHEMRNVANDPAYEEIKRQLCARMWRFAYQQNDQSVLNPYITVGLAPYGPAEAFR